MYLRTKIFSHFEQHNFIATHVKIAMCCLKITYTVIEKKDEKKRAESSAMRYENAQKFTQAQGAIQART